ncbi:ABC transporter permease [Agrobacterium sp. MS2]|uniref:ABC transporter permease n=1 Tax=Agrobacterium sp. MS2 TaxID=1345498 RepID=UPI000DBF5061|nr:ABC transporter permease [Agrobacterium sp. MS2]RAL96038.1 ABC transporter permease [Agrobacterium sp. MS2]
MATEITNNPTRKLFLQSGTVVALLIVWVGLSNGLRIDPIYIPGPQNLYDRFMQMRALLPSALGYSLTIILGGYIAGSVAGVLTALVMAYSIIIRESVEPVVDTLRPVPIFALIPLFLLWFGVGFGSQIGLVAFGCFVILVVSTSEAVKNVPQIYVNAARTLGADRRRLFLTIVVPAIVPNLVGAMRVAAAQSFGLDVAAEFIGAQNGLGYLLINSSSYLNTDGIILIVIIYTVLAFLLDRLVAISTNRLIGWARRTRH